MSIRINSFQAGFTAKSWTHDNVAIELHYTEEQVPYVFYKSKFGTMRSFVCAVDPDVSTRVHSMFADLHKDETITSQLDDWLETKTP